MFAKMFHFQFEDNIFLGGVVCCLISVCAGCWAELCFIIVFLSKYIYICQYSGSG